jgi:hypothetical protein
LRAPVELVLLNPETLDGLDVAGTEAYTYCCAEVCAEAGNLALRKTLSAKSRGIGTERRRIREERGKPKNGKGSFLAAIDLPRPSVMRISGFREGNVCDARVRPQSADVNENYLIR